jgi:hypothetical protein
MLSRSLYRLHFRLLGLGAAALVLVAVGGAATGGNFILGQANLADKTTALTVNTLPPTCPTPCEAFQVTDNNTALNAGGLGVLGKSPSAPAATIKNSGGAPALNLLVNAGKPPFTVNSAKVVTNLNADLLDGLHSTGLPYWKLGGNAATIPGTNFIGTTDAKALELKVNGQRALRLEPATSASFPGVTPNVVAGFSANSVSAGVVGATIAGGGSSGRANIVQSHFATIGGGDLNQASAIEASVGGGSGNIASSNQATVAGGFGNQATEPGDAIGGGFSNHTSSSADGGGSSVIAGGQLNGTAGIEAAIGGGANNNASGGSVVAGGINNAASGTRAVIGGGANNTAGGRSVVAGGEGNTATGFFSAVAGGLDNRAGPYAAVAGGQNNVAAGTASIVAGGESNTANGDDSFAAGRRAHADYPNTFVWADVLPFAFNATSANQFLIRATGGVGIGTNLPLTQLHVAHAINDTATLANHVALVQNTSTGSSGDVLALKLGYTGNPTTSNNFITFFKGDSSSVGSIEGNNSGGVTLAGPGSDYAEWLPQLKAGEAVRPGDLVGVVGGRISKATRGATQVMVVTDSAIVAGNDPGETKRPGSAPVAFVGQVQARVRGPVHAGDLIVPSGREDGTGVAVPPRSISPEQLLGVVGQAWTAAPAPGVKKVRVAIGVGGSGAVPALYRQNLALRRQSAGLNARLAKLERAVARLSR